MDAPVTYDRFEFEGFCLDRRSGGLFRHDPAGGATPVAIGSRALDVLGVLLAHPGELLSKQAIMQAVWPGMVVDEKNLTVQIATLRRVLDDGRADRSCIQTEAGRGYRFVAPVARPSGEEVDAHGPPSPADPRLTSVPSTPTNAMPVEPAPRLSIVVLPFQNLSGDAEDDYLADAVTDDLTTDLSHIGGAFVIARESAYTYKGRRTNVRQIGRELGVRYVLEGSIRRIGDILRVNVQLISAETGAHLWSDRFNEEIRQLAAGQERIVARLSDTIGFSMTDIEAARSLRERPTNPDAFDLVLRARSLAHLPLMSERLAELLALYERALALDPQSFPAMVGVAYHLIDTPPGIWGSYGRMRRAERLLAQADRLRPGAPEVLNGRLYWLLSVGGRGAEVIEAGEHAIRNDPNRLRTFAAVYSKLAISKVRTGRAEEGLALQAQADQLNPRSIHKVSRYRHMGFAALMLGRDQDAIAFIQRGLAMNSDFTGRRGMYLTLAAANARTGQLEEARRWVSASDRESPFGTVRSIYPEELSSPVYIQQMRDYQVSLRLAGLRDHAKEDADFGIPADAALHGELAGHTSTTAPGVVTIRTGALERLLAGVHPLVIDTVSNSWGRSIPGAIGLKFSGLGGSFTDEAQDRLRRKMAELTGGVLDRPVVAVGWNSERFDGRNLALRLAALGYTRVYWYRGGREAWEVAELPEAELAVQDW